MPSMGMYTEEGVLSAWLRPAGTRVTIGEPIAEITTEKATFEIPAPEDGILSPVASVGTSLRVEALMGYVLGDGEAVPVDSLGDTNTGATKRSPGMSSVTVDHGESPVRPLRASPVAKRIAAQHGIDLHQVTGSGPGGRIIEADILALVSKRSDTIQTRGADEQVAERQPLAGLRRSLAERLHTTLRTAASTTLTREMNAGVLVAARRSLTEKLRQAPSYDALFIKLFAAALRERPELNATIENDAIVRFKKINVGFAVAAPNGLIVPVVRDADSRTLADTAQIVRELTDRVLAGRLQPTDLEGGTATITNLGGHGIDAFTPILNGSQSAILGIGRIMQAPVVRDGQLAIGHTCILSLTFDHRVVDGAPAALLLDAIVQRANDELFFDSVRGD